MKKILAFLTLIFICTTQVSASYETVKLLCGDGEFLQGNEATTCRDASGILVDAGITASDISNWDTAFSWGNHADAGYITDANDTVDWSEITGIVGTGANQVAAGNHTHSLSLTGDVTGTGTVAGSIGTDIATGVVGPNELASTGVTAGSYTNADITVDADGRITAASSGGGASGGSITLSCNCNNSNDDDFGNLCFNGTNFVGCKDDPNTAGSQGMWFILDTVN